MYSKKKTIREFAKRYGYTIASSEELYDEICDYVKYKLESGDPIWLEGVGRFVIRTAPATKRYNFKTKCTQEYPPRRYPDFEYTEKFKDTIAAQEVNSEV